MKPSVLLVTAAVFVGAILLFSSAYNTLLRFFEHPTAERLLALAGWTLALLVALGALGLIMYATERGAGNVKVKMPLFERLLGQAPDATLPVNPSAALEPAPPRASSKAPPKSKETKR